MILYFSYAGRIKQRILCCRKFVTMFGSSDLFTLACENIRFSSLFAAGDVSRNVPSGEERGETDVSAGYVHPGRLIEQLLALAECRLLKFSFRTWQKYCILSFLSLDRFSEGILIYISSKKNAFIPVFTPTIRHFETGLFKKSGKIR